MIYCPQCKTANRDGSRFCNECGSDLAKALRRCQACGMLNPAQQLNCTQCGARLQLLADDEPEETPEEEVQPLPSSPRVALIPPETEPSAHLPGHPDLLSAPQAAGPAAVQQPNSADMGVLRQAGKSPTLVRQTPGESAGTQPVIPDWMRDIVPAAEPEAVPTEALTPPAVAEVDAAGAHMGGTAGADIPDWLRDFERETPDPQTTDASSPEYTPGPQAVPDWLADLNAPASTAVSMAAAAAPAGETRAGVEATLAESADMGPAALPEWLQEIATTAPPAEAEPANLSGVAVEELPDWLKPSTEPEVPPADKPGSKPAPLTLTPGEIPAWVAGLRPMGLMPLSGEPVETSGLLAGVRGALPVESALVQPHQYVEFRPPETKVPVTGFSDLFAPKPAPAVAEKPAPKPRSRWTLRIILSLLILLVIAVAFLPLPIISDLRGSNIAAFQPSRDFYETVNRAGALQPGAPVLVAIDYSAGSRDEMDPQAKAVLLNLFENKQHIIALSFVSDGGQLAQDLLNARNPSNTQFSYPYSYGDTHINLGFLSGGDASMRALAQNPATVFTAGDFRDHKPLTDWTIGRSWKSLDDVALIVVFSDTAADVARWIEQVSTQPNKPHRTIVAGVSKAAETAVTPYYESKQLNGLLAGTHGAAEYEGFLLQPASASATLDATAYVSIVVVVVLVLSILGLLFARRPRAGSA